jgi:adenylate cyclase
MLPHRVRRRAYALLLAACGALAVAVVASLDRASRDLLEPVELWTVDLRFRLRPPLPVPTHQSEKQSDAVVIIDYDDRAAQEYGLGRWPWSRRVHAEVLGWLKAGKARAVLFDLLFDRAAGMAEDEALIGAVAQAGTVVLPVLVKPSTEATSLMIVPRTRARFLWHGRVGGTGELPGAADVVWPMPLLLDQAAAVGHIQRTVDLDGVLRRVPVVYVTPDGFLPSLSLAAAFNLLAADPNSFHIERGRQLTFTTGTGQRIGVPVDAKGRAWINYAGPWGQRFPHYPYSWLRHEIEETDGQERLTEWFQGKTVIVTNLTTGSVDQGPVPFERDFPFGEVHAHILNMILTQQFLRDARPTERGLAIALPVALLTGSALAGGPMLILPVFVVVLTTYVLAIQHAFSGHAVIMPAVGPILALTLALILLIAARFFIVDRERLRFLSVLGAMLPPHTLREIQRRPDRIQHLLAGRRRELTMLFADLQDFSAFCQKADPAQVQRLLREYRTALTDILRANGGTLDKYTGDEVMAFFGDAEPEGGGDEAEEARVQRHATNAVRAGLAIQIKMRELNERWWQQGLQPHLVRIGISTGHVTIGNFGTEQLWQYGIVGSEVNKTKRLEGAAEPGGLLLGHRTYILARKSGELPSDLLSISATLKGFGEEAELYAIPPDLVGKL